ncbi:ComEA family DNA-binding protein [Evtepia sp.]|uniref:ComEA family DNA-binding protein n=1 Tax=Evtepia sp. TaxID=2773933 RepID=UPI003F191BA2
MKAIFKKISPLEGTVLILTLLFVLGTLLWFRVSRPAEGLTFVETGETGRTVSAPEQRSAPGMLEGEVLDLNTASQADLTRLPGIGEKKAAAILAWREEHGPFQVVEDVMSVDGIGEKILADIRPYVTVVIPAAEEGGT